MNYGYHRTYIYVCIITATHAFHYVGDIVIIPVKLGHQLNNPSVITSSGKWRIVQIADFPYFVKNFIHGQITDFRFIPDTPTNAN